MIEDELRTSFNLLLKEASANVSTMYNFKLLYFVFCELWQTTGNEYRLKFEDLIDTSINSSILKDQTHNTTQYNKMKDQMALKFNINGESSLKMLIANIQANTDEINQIKQEFAQLKHSMDLLKNL